MAEIIATSLSEAWTGAVRIALESKKHEVVPLTVVVELNDTAAELNRKLEKRLDKVLERNRKQCVETVARTIFPNGLWNPSSPRQQLYERYRKILPKLHHYSQNRRGLYFERMITQPGKAGKDFNQLEHVITAYNSGTHRRTTLQATPLIPWRDLNRATRLGFPCLQQVAFLPDCATGTLTVLGFYPLHHLFERAYGNYLGLVWLGSFMAHEMSLRLTRMMCVAAVAKLEVPARVARPLVE